MKTKLLYGTPPYFPVLICLVLISYLVYGGNDAHVLLFWDDVSYISRNPWVTDPSWDGIVGLFTKFHHLNWHPITWLSYIPEYYLCGETAWCYKATNIFIHAINCFLVFCITQLVFYRYANQKQYQSRIIIAGIVSSILFAMHAQHVESVIWVAERKDVLCALFYFAGLYSYLKYHIDQRPEIKWVPFLFFFLALLSKSIAITFPLMLILLDYYPLERFNKKSLLLIFKEKIHYFLGSGVVVMITLLSQDVANVHQPSIVDTFWMVCLSIQHYILSFLYLEQLSPFHPEAIINDRNIQTYACLVIILVTAISSVIKFKKPAIAFILFFIISSFPILGIVNVGDHAYADRYAYIPVLPFYLLTGWLISGVWHKSENLRAGLLVLVIISLFFIGMVTREYKEIWKSDRDLWTYVADLYPQTSSIVHDNLGVTLLMEEDYESAIEQFNLAISLNNTPVDICKNRAFAYSYLGRFDDVLTSYHECIDIMPDNYLIHLHTGDAYLARGVKQSAHTYYTRTLDLVARNLMNVISDPDALLRLGTVFFQLGDNDRAVYALELVININQERRNDAQVILDANR